LGNPGTTTEFWMNNIDGFLDQATTYYGCGLITRMTVELGEGEFVLTHNSCNDCCYGATASEGLAAAVQYQTNMRVIINKIYAYAPHVHLVLLVPCDPSNGEGIWVPTSVFLAFRQAIYNLQKANPSIRVADIYTLMLGHPEYYAIDNTIHPNNLAHSNVDLVQAMRNFRATTRFHPNDLGQSMIAAAIEAQFANWP